MGVSDHHTCAYFSFIFRNCTSKVSLESFSSRRFLNWWLVEFLNSSRWHLVVPANLFSGITASFNQLLLCQVHRYQAVTANSSAAWGWFWIRANKSGNEPREIMALSIHLKSWFHMGWVASHSQGACDIVVFLCFYIHLIFLLLSS